MYIRVFHTRRCEVIDIGRVDARGDAPADLLRVSGYSAANSQEAPQARRPGWTEAGESSVVTFLKTFSVEYL